MDELGLSVARRLMGRLRDVMAGAGNAQERLDQVVRLIASNMVAEVCSCYVMRAGEVLELFATEGLLKGAVHQTRLRVDEGLVGDIAAYARPLALSDAQSHPKYVYRPETGEEIYRSFLGVPIIRGRRVVAVMVIQNRSSRHYTEEEIELLETVSMVVGELIIGGDLINREEILPVEGNALLPVRMEGLRIVQGIGVGIAVMHQPKVVIEKFVSEDPDHEMERLKEALSGLYSSLDELIASSDLGDRGEHVDILETYRMFAEDSGWIAKISEAIKSGLTAEAAVSKVHEDTSLRMEQITDPYIRERLNDLDDLVNRLLRHLSHGESATGTAAQGELPDSFILVGRSMGPTELLDYDRKRLRGLVLEEGTATMHVAIIARALDIPLIGQVKGILGKIESGDPMIMDGNSGLIYVRPGDDVVETFLESIKLQKMKTEIYAAMRDVPAVTTDGEEIGIYMNAGLLSDLPYLEATGADGVGLYRTELIFMTRPRMPGVNEQAGLYRRILEQANGKSVAFRTLDVGGDKVLPYWNGEKEDNPAMGWRSIRITLDRPAIMRQQLRAFVLGAAGHDLSVMFPMIAEVAELDYARQLLDGELERAARQGHEPPRSVRVGTMLEVPALAWQMRALLSRVDFISVGSNDLTQFLFAVDRGNPYISERYDVLSPPMLMFLREVAALCANADVSLSVCGEMAGRPLEAMALIGVGIRNLSMSASSVGPVKEMIRSLPLSLLWDYMESQIDSSNHSLRSKLRSFALDHGVVIG